MRIEYNEDKRREVLSARDLDIARAGDVFERYHLTRWDEGHSQAENRFISVGLYDARVVIVVWTEREDARRVITMWKANDREQAAYFERRGDGHGNEA